MKKIVLFLTCCLLSSHMVFAKDYVKLQAKEMKQAQKYNATNQFFQAEKMTENLKISEVKDPKLLKIGDYQIISNEQYNKKLAEDNLAYKKIESDFKLQKSDSFNQQAYSRDFYQVYRIAEKIIRANNLDFVDWRIRITADEDFNAYSSEMNFININTGLLDSLSTNEDALALVIGHEMGHAILGHMKRKNEYIAKLNRFKNPNSTEQSVTYVVLYKKFLAESRQMEFAADTEGAKLITKAGFDLSNARETLDFMNTIDANRNEWSNSHPNSDKRIASFIDNRKYFVEDEWVKQGRYNIFNSKVLNCKNSSDRKSIVIERGPKRETSKYYHPETMPELYLRYAYKSYLNGKFNDAEKYFLSVINENKSNPYVYLYLSYTEEELYKKEHKDKYIQNARSYAKIAQGLDSNNKYINEQVQALNDL